MPVLECGPFDPLLLVEICFAVAELQHVGSSFPVLAVELERASAFLRLYRRLNHSPPLCVGVDPSRSTVCFGMRAPGELSVPLPSLDEQRRIAAILDQADDLRRKRREALGRLGSFTQSVFLMMFGDWSGPGFNGKLESVGAKLDFLTSGSRGWAEYYRESGDLFLRIQNVKHDELDLEDVAYVEPQESPHFEVGAITSHLSDRIS